MIGRSHLKNWVREMQHDGEVLRAGFSQKEKRSLGFVVNSYKVFSKYHPALVMALKPIPECEQRDHYNGNHENDVSSIDGEVEGTGDLIYENGKQVTKELK